jgi:hypothetical protein
MTNRYFNNAVDLLPLTRARSGDVETNFNQVESGFDTVQTEMDLKAPLASPSFTGTSNFTGTVALPSTTSIGNVSNVEISHLDGVTSPLQAQIDLKAPLASPALTGTPTAPTATAGTSTDQLATTAFVTATAFSVTLPGQGGNTGKVLRTDGTNANWDWAALLRVSYDDRNNLRSLTPLNGDQALVEGLGVFRFELGSTELDDDETCFATATGRWVLDAASAEMVEALFLMMYPAQEERLDALELYNTDTNAPARLTTLEGAALVGGTSRFLTGTGTTTITTLATVSQASTTATVTGAAAGDIVTVNATSLISPLLAVYGYVSSANTVTIVINNPSATSATLTNPTTWRVTVIRG